jgi:hypothetical protein
MANPAVTYTFVNGVTADAAEVNQNFTDIINGLTDGTKDLSISAITAAGTATFNGAVNLGNASADDISVNGSIATHVVPKTTGTYNLGSTSLGYLGMYQSAGASYTFSWLGSTSASASYTLTVPTATGVVGQGLVVSSSGVLSWKPIAVDTAAKSDAYTITDTDGIRTVLVTTGASDRIVTLPTAADNTHRIITVKKVDSGAGKITLKSDAAGETIDGVSGTTGIDVESQYEQITVQCDGSVWHILVALATEGRPGLLVYDETNLVINTDLTVSGSSGITSVSIDSGFLRLVKVGKTVRAWVNIVNANTAGSSGTGIIYLNSVPEGWRPAYATVLVMAISGNLITANTTNVPLSVRVNTLGRIEIYANGVGSLFDSSDSFSSFLASSANSETYLGEWVID